MPEKSVERAHRRAVATPARARTQNRSSSPRAATVPHNNGSSTGAPALFSPRSSLQDGDTGRGIGSTASELLCSRPETARVPHREAVRWIEAIPSAVTAHAQTTGPWSSGSDSGGRKGRRILLPRSHQGWPGRLARTNRRRARQLAGMRDTSVRPSAKRFRVRSISNFNRAAECRREAAAIVGPTRNNRIATGLHGASRSCRWRGRGPRPARNSQAGAPCMWRRPTGCFPA